MITLNLFTRDLIDHLETPAISPSQMYNTAGTFRGFVYRKNCFEYWISELNKKLTEITNIFLPCTWLFNKKMIQKLVDKYVFNLSILGYVSHVLENNYEEYSNLSDIIAILSEESKKLIGKVMNDYSKCGYDINKHEIVEKPRFKRV